jgi:UDPglucose--hexose-1-phosphate uridylyltransferase
MPELRLNPVTRRWIVTGKRTVMPDVTEQDGVCAFCPGNERLTPKAIVETHDAGGAWTTRVFHDRAPIFQIETALNPRGEGMYDRMNTLGAHEILVETPEHAVQMSRLPAEQLVRVIEVCRDRILDLKRDRRFRYVSLYKVQRDVAAQWLAHSHSHILASPVLPQIMQIELRWCQEHFEIKERCLFCDMISQEIRQEKRVVNQSQEFVALCPFASRSPYEVWIMPLGHSSSFEKDVTNPARACSLAAFFKNTLARVENITPTFTIVVHTEPNLQAHGWPKSYWATVADDYHWHIEINPEIEGERRVLGSEGFYFNPIPAEEAALVLRALEPAADPAAPE